MKKNFVLSNKGKGFSAKLAPHFVGPYVLQEQLAANIFKLVDPEDNDKVIGNFDTKDLKPYPGAQR